MLAVGAARTCSGRAPASRAAGFTVIELITSIVLIGILGAVAAPRFFDNRAFRERGYIDEVASALRYAQKVAIASQCSVAVTISAGSYVAMQRAAAGNACNPAGAWTTPVRRADGSALSGTVPDGVQAAPAAVIEFNGTGGLAGGAPAIDVGVHTLTVDPISGLVRVQP